MADDFQQADFWVVIGTAVPVFFLAHAVLVNRSIVNMHGLLAKHILAFREARGWRSRGRACGRYVLDVVLFRDFRAFAYAISFAIFFLDAILFVAALLSLDRRENAMQPSSAVGLFIALVAMQGVLVLVTSARTAVEEMNRATKPAGK